MQAGTKIFRNTACFSYSFPHIPVIGVVKKVYIKNPITATAPTRMRRDKAPEIISCIKRGFDLSPLWQINSTRLTINQTNAAIGKEYKPSSIRKNIFTLLSASFYNEDGREERPDRRPSKRWEYTKACLRTSLPLLISA